jgi:formylglycine-generating enzyme required for sulfatase activity
MPVPHSEFRKPLPTMPFDSTVAPRSAHSGSWPIQSQVKQSRADKCANAIELVRGELKVLSPASPPRTNVVSIEDKVMLALILSSRKDQSQRSRPARELALAFFRFSLLLALTGFCCHTQAQRTATATAVVTNGVVAGVTVIDGGGGYTSAPAVVLGGSAGSGATASALVTNGVVSSIQVLNGGAGFTNAPGVGIAPPDAPAITLNLLPGPRVAVTGPLGSTLALQAANSLGAGAAWSSLATIQLTNYPWVFGDTLRPVAGQRFYRVVQRGMERPAVPQEFVWLPPGSFTMGTAASDPDYLTCEGPQSQVRLTQGFFLCQHEVTEEEYVKVTGTNPSYFVGETNLPVESVSWEEATNYCALLTAQEQAAGRLPAGWRYRLPTEAEWEYASRAGTPSILPVGEQEDFYGQRAQSAWFADTASQMSAPVGQLRPNGWGLFDMSGNVAEWCWDVFGDYPGGKVADPVGPAVGQYHVARGGSWNDPAERCRSAARASYSTVGTAYRSPQIGFRVALGPVYAQGQPVVQSAPLGGTITGQVTMRTGGAPVPGVQVTLVNTNVVANTNDYQLNRQGLVQVAMTDLDGKYSFSSIKPGDYAVVPMHSDATITYQLALAGSSDPAELAVSNNTHEVCFNVNSVSLNEGGGNLTYDIYIINGPYAGLAIYAYRSVWMLFSSTWSPVGYLESPPGPYYKLEAQNAMSIWLAGENNTWRLELREFEWKTRPEFYKVIATQEISFPRNATPSVASYNWDYLTGNLTRIK